MKYQIIIPCKDEYKNLKIIIPLLTKLYNYEILIIDKSKKKQLLKNFCKKYKKVIFINQMSSGKGNALLEAAKLSNSKIIIFFDADCSHNPKDIKKMISMFERYPYLDHVGGSRMRGGSDELFRDFDHLIRLLGSLIINIIINLKFNSKITDSQNGFRAIIRKKFLNLNLKSNHTSIETELVAKSLSRGLNYMEIPTHEWQRVYGSSKINLFLHSWSYIWVLIKIIFFKKNKKKSFRIVKNYWHEKFK
jgi:glycosyltransferase involved in cell wall biosynthesis